MSVTAEEEKIRIADCELSRAKHALSPSAALRINSAEGTQSALSKEFLIKNSELCELGASVVK